MKMHDSARLLTETLQDLTRFLKKIFFNAENIEVSEKIGLTLISKAPTKCS